MKPYFKYLYVAAAVALIVWPLGAYWGVLYAVRETDRLFVCEARK